MDGVLEDILSFSWWFTVVIVGVLVGIIANYLPRILGLFFNRWKERAIRLSEERRESVRSLALFPDQISDQFSIGIYFLIISVFLILFGMTMYYARSANILDLNVSEKGPIFSYDNIGPLIYFVLSALLVVLGLRYLLMSLNIYADALAARRERLKMEIKGLKEMEGKAEKLKEVFESQEQNVDGEDED